MTDLTEKWKKGELPSGYYYIRVRELSGLYIDYYNAETDDWDANYPKNIETIIAPVPSYEEWKANQKWIKSLEEKIKIYERKDKQATETSIAYNKLLEENAQLKELLKECKRYIDIWGYTDTHGNLLLPQINQALGEDK